MSGLHVASSAHARGPTQNRKLRICVLHSSLEDSTSEFKDVDPYCKPEVYDKAGKYEWHNALIKKATTGQQLVQLAKQGFDVFLNLCDGAFDEDRAGVEVVHALERLELAYTGANPTFYEPTKVEMKMAAHYYDVPHPKWVHAKRMDDVAKALQGLAFPMIVKHHSGYGSIGMTRDSRCTTPEQLTEQVAKFLEAYGGALIEEFIEGREFTVLVVENPQDPDQPHAYAPVECIFGPGESFKHFELKWIDYESMKWQPCEDAVLCDRLKQHAKAAFIANRGVSYGRSDFRVDAEGRIYFLEINPNCGILYPPDAHGSADYILSLDPENSQASFIDSIVECALARHAQRQGKVEVVFSPGSGFGLYARVDLKAGETVVYYEHKPTNIVSLRYVQRHWPPGSKNRQWFEEYAYPLSDDIYATWSDDPRDWVPINHSCDPNCWLDGLQAVAKRDIQAGEQITMEYATFCVENCKAFDCSCGAASCRRRVTGTDYLLPLVEAYGDHVSAYVASKRRAKLSQQQ